MGHLLPNYYSNNFLEPTVTLEVSEDWINTVQNKIKSTDVTAKMTMEKTETVKTLVGNVTTQLNLMSEQAKTPPNPNEDKILKLVKFAGTNHDLLKKITEAVETFSSSTPIAEEKTTEKPKGPLSLKEFLKSTLGASLNKFNQEMAIDREEAKALTVWWDERLLQWRQDGTYNTAAFHRAVNCWTSVIATTWKKLLMEFIKNPFSLSLQEICLDVAQINNALEHLGMVKNAKAKISWAKPFPEMSKFWFSIMIISFFGNN